MPNPYLTPRTFAFLRELAANNRVSGSWPTSRATSSSCATRCCSWSRTSHKTYAALSFRHIDGKEIPAPGYYLHVEPGRIFLGAGMWHAQTGPLRDIRDAIVAHPERWKRVRASRSFRLDGEDALVRAPRGYDPQHPFVDDLKRKSFISTADCTQAQACTSDFLSRLERECRKRVPLMEFLSHAVGVPW